MAELIRNTHVPGHGWWGPAYGRVKPPPVVAALISNPACWDAPPVEPEGFPGGVVMDSGAVEILASSGVGGPASPMVSTGTAGAGDDGTDPQTDPEPAPTPLDLDALDKPALLALAAERGVEVDGRWGEKRLREALRNAEEG